MLKLKTIKLVLISFTALFIITLWICNSIVTTSTDKLIYKTVLEIPHKKVGLLLGTSKTLNSGKPNQHFFNRITATVELYNSKKIDIIIISGDSSSKEYNEPRDMEIELIKRGIPKNKIHLDYAGFSTYDSVLRIDKIFGQKEFTIISQEFHIRRAIYIANNKNLKAIGYCAEDVNSYGGFKTKLREKFARVKLFIDLLINKEPVFLGDRIAV